MKMIVRSTNEVSVKSITDWILNNVVPFVPCGIVIQGIVEDRKIFSHVNEKICKDSAKDVVEIYSVLSPSEIKLAINLELSTNILKLEITDKSRQAEALAIRQLEKSIKINCTREYYPFVSSWWLCHSKKDWLQPVLVLFKNLYIVFHY